MSAETSPCRVRQPGPPARVEDADAPIVHDPCFAEVLRPGAALLSLYDQALFSEGPVWWPAREMLVWSDIEGRRVYGWHPDGAVDVVLDATAFINGNALDADGRLIHCEHGRRGISRTDERGETAMLVGEYGGRRLNSPNDLVLGPDGAIWFTDPTYGLLNPRQGCPATPELGHRSIYRFREATGKLTRMADMEQPNGLAFSPDGRTLYVSDTAEDRHHILAFTVGADGSLADRRVFRVIEPGLPDGFCVDARGWVWTSSGAGVQVFAPDGTPLGTIPTPHGCTNCAFGGPDGRRLFITGDESLWALDFAG
ncbi:MAG TPA: SMP-30/gluconolactonase/LRE family protein [Longimicrobium sp.]|nr:SMP-30/gluconolactonase/LRE family protein [Longimicrobium sp.]